MLSDLLDLEDSDIAVLYQSIRSPGCEITRSNRRIMNLGTPVSAIAEKRLKLVRFMSQHYFFQINRTVSENDLINQELSRMVQLKSIQGSHKEPDSVPIIKGPYNMVALLSSLDDKLPQYWGIRGILLTYLIREDCTLPAEATDPSMDYVTVDVEMVARAPHFNRGVGGTQRNCLAYNIDNQHLAALRKEMIEIFRSAGTWAKVLMRKLNGIGITIAKMRQ